MKRRNFFKGLLGLSALAGIAKADVVEKVKESELDLVQDGMTRQWLLLPYRSPKVLIPFIINGNRMGDALYEYVQHDWKSKLNYYHLLELRLNKT